MKSLKQKLMDVARELKALTKETEKLTRAIEKLEKGSSSKKAKKTISKKASETVRKNAMKIIAAQRKKGLSFEKIARYLENQKIPTFSGKGKWRGQTVHKLNK
jgi:hypothetical protein